MHTHSLRDHKNKHTPTVRGEVQYLALTKEPKEVTAASRGSFGYHSRYLAKQRLMRQIRRLRRNKLW